MSDQSIEFAVLISHRITETVLLFFTLQGKIFYPGRLARVKFYPEISGQGKLYELF